MASSHALKHALNITAFVTDQALYSKTLCGNHNEKRTRPLWFSQVCEGSDVRSVLFRLPSELLDHIAGFLSITDLASLALVNTACRQLARSRQFSNIYLSYVTPASLDIGEILVSESKARTKNPLALRPTLGACVRKLTIASVLLMPSYFVKLWKPDSTSALFRPDVTRDRWIELVAKNYFDVYVRDLGYILMWALPNLEMLRWEDKVCVTPELLNAIAASGIRELELSGVFVDQEFAIERRQGWGLRRLLVDVRRAKGCESISTAPLCMSILKAAASSLEELEWINGEVMRFDAAEFEPPLRFPKLRSLVLKNTKLGSGLLEALISENSPQLRLRSLLVDSPSTSMYLYRRGHIDTLQTFHAPTNLISSDTAFISANTQLQALTVPHPNDPLVLNSFLPILVSFQHLANLHLVWNSKTIDTHALESIGRVQSLTHLWLSAGTQSGNVHDWLAPHGTMITAFRRLQKLQTLVFTRDTYEHPLSGEAPEKYYVLRQHPNGIEGEGVNLQQRLEAAWELWHVEKMRRVASEYAHVLERLERMFLGQLKAEVRKDWWKEPEKRLSDWCFDKANFGSWIPSQISSL